MGRLRLLYDVGLLATVPPERRSGLCRMTETVLCYLARCPAVEVYPCLWTKDKYLSSRLDELGLSDLKRRIVRLPLLRYHTDDRHLIRRLKAWILSFWAKAAYASVFRQFDCLFESYLRVPDVIYQSDLPVVSYLHDMIPIVHPEYSDASFAASYRRWMQAVQSDVLLCDSESSRADFLAFRPDYPADRAHVVYLGVDDAFYPDIDTNEIAAVRQRYGISEKRYFFALSAESPRKNFPHLLEAFVHFIERVPQSDIVLVIGGPETRRLSSFLEQYPALRPRIVLAGFIDEKDLPAVYAGAEAFIYPSLYEGFGLPPLEAMACGTPVICCDNSSLPEIGGDAPLYINGTDVIQTAFALERVYQSQSLRQEMREKGIARARRFSWNKTVRRICSFINSSAFKGEKNDTKSTKNSNDFGNYRSGRRLSGQIPVG